MTSQPKSQPRNWIVIVPLATIAAAYLYFVFLPTRTTVTGMRQEIATKQDFVTTAQRLRTTLDEGNRQLTKTAAYVEACRKRLPQEKELSAAYGKIQTLADGAGVRITRFDPQPPEIYGTFRRIPCALGCEGSFPQVYDFIRRLEEMPTASWIGSLRIERGGRDGRSATGELALAIFSENPDNSDYVKASD